MFRTLTAKYPGTCKRCAGRITPGQTIRYGGRGLTYHLANSDACRPGRLATDQDTTPDDPHEFHTLNDADPIAQADQDAQPDAPTFDRSVMVDF